MPSFRIESNLAAINNAKTTNEMVGQGAIRGSRYCGGRRRSQLPAKPGSSSKISAHMHRDSGGDAYVNRKGELRELRRTWDAAAESYDNEADHGLRDADVLRAWTRLLDQWLPERTASVLDVGCGTGSLSLVLAGLGHRVTGIDLSTAMLAKARAKAIESGQRIALHCMDAAAPGFPPESFDAIVCRHLLWIFPEPAAVLRRWVELLKPGGRMILIEGYWNNGGGLHAVSVATALPASLDMIAVQDLSSQPLYWGRAVIDERYAVIAERLPDA